MICEVKHLETELAFRIRNLKVLFVVAMYERVAKFQRISHIGDATHPGLFAYKTR